MLVLVCSSACAVLAQAPPPRARLWSQDSRCAPDDLAQPTSCATVLTWSTVGLEPTGVVKLKKGPYLVDCGAVNAAGHRRIDLGSADQETFSLVWSEGCDPGDVELPLGAATTVTRGMLTATPASCEPTPGGDDCVALPGGHRAVIDWRVDPSASAGRLRLASRAPDGAWVELVGCADQLTGAADLDVPVNPFVEVMVETASDCSFADARPLDRISLYQWAGDGSGGRGRLWPSEFYPCTTAPGGSGCDPRPWLLWTTWAVADGMKLELQHVSEAGRTVLACSDAVNRPGALEMPAALGEPGPWTFELHLTSDCLSGPAANAIASTTIAPAPSGTLTSPACDPPCSPIPELSWTAANVNRDVTPYLAIHHLDSDGATVVDACVPVGPSGSHRPELAVSRSTPRTYTLVAATDCTATPLLAFDLAATTQRTTEEQGSIAAVSNPCLEQEAQAGTPHCHPIIQWELFNPQAPRVVITAGGDPWRCLPAAGSGSEDSDPEVAVDADSPVPFSLYAAAADCRPLRFLASTAARAHELGSVVCPVDNRAMTADADFLGIEANELYYDGWNPEPRFDLANIAAETKEAGATFIRQTIRWDWIQPCDPLDPICTPQEGGPSCGEDPSVCMPSFGFYDALFDPFTEWWNPASPGIELWLTLSRVPAWAAAEQYGCDDPDPASRHACCDENLCPPRPCSAHLEPQYCYEHYIADVISHFSGRYGEDARNWEILQEPGIDLFFMGTTGEYVDMLRRSHRIIHALEPTARVWVPNSIVATNTNSVIADKFLSAALDVAVEESWPASSFGLSAHTFFREGETGQNVRVVEHLKSRMESALGCVADCSGSPGGPMRFATSVVKSDAGTATCAETCPPIALTTLAFFASPFEPNACDMAHLSDGERARFVIDNLACVANAGADHAMWYKTTEQRFSECGRDASIFFDRSDRMGLLDERGEARTDLFSAIQEVGCWVNPEVGCGGGP